MKKILLVTGCWFLVAGLSAQPVTQKLQKAFQQFESDSQLKHAISSLYVIDAKTGQVIFDKNSQMGLAPASTQKIITSVTAFELLGKDYRYRTEFGYNGKISNDTLYGAIVIKASGDPTLGSWRYVSTSQKFVFQKVFDFFKNRNIVSVKVRMLLSNVEKYSFKGIPDGWIWQDIGNYYGAGAQIFNWKENQYDIYLKSGSQIGSRITAESNQKYFFNELISASDGSGDNAYIYESFGSTPGVLSGTIPINQNSFKISGSVSEPFNEFSLNLADSSERRIFRGGNFRIWPRQFMSQEKESFLGIIPIYTHFSPSLDSIIYWFLKKSVNLYGEALIKTFAYEKQGFGSTDSGVAIVKKFWKDKGLDDDELNIYDGSGLSPLSRVTTHAQVEILKYARTKDWFPYFYDALPEYNNMKMKSGTISDVKGFCGYHKSKNGKEYIFSFLINNYSGKTSGVVNKMYKVLDELK